MPACKMTVVTVLAVCMALVVVALASSAYAADYTLIAADQRAIGVSGATTPAALSAASRYRPVQLNQALTAQEGPAEGDTLTLNLFPDVVYAAQVDRVSTNVNGTRTARGRIAQYPMAYTLMSTTGNRTVVEVEIPETNEHYIVQSDELGTHYVADMSGTQTDELEGSAPLVPPVQTMAVNEALPSALGPDDPATVDVLVVYTPAARSYANTSQGGIANVIAQAMAKGQLACDNSNTILTMRLAHSAETNYTESGDSSDDLSRLTNTSDGHMDEVHSLRNTYKADQVTLLARVDDTGGIAWLLNSTSGRQQYAFALCRVQQSSSGYTVIHEQGHNMGCGHHKEQTTQPGPGLYSYSAGWRWTGTNGSRYCSVMTYASGSYFPDGLSHTTVGYWSNPSIIHQGMPTGDATDGDNARGLRQIKHVIAAYRACTSPSISTHPSSQTKCAGQPVTLTVAASGTPDLSYQWRKNGVNVGTNSSSYTISSVQASHAGDYDCLVSNRCGSAVSNVATLTVGTGPTITTQPSSVIICVSQPVSFTVVASGSTPLNYQWRKNGSNVGTNSPTYSIASAQASHSGNYDCVVSNSCGSVTSSVATLAVTTGPIITGQPSNTFTWPGGPASFSVAATGSGTLSYQWRKGGANIDGAIAATYSIEAASPADAGSYDCVLTDNCGSVTSGLATLSVLTPTSSIADAKLIADGQPVAILGKPITFDSENFFYIEETGRGAGIRVELANHGLTEGACADLAGLLSTNAEGERFIAATAAVGNGSDSVPPVTMANAALCGSDWQYDANAHTGQRGGTELLGLNNVGLLVKTWGLYTKTSDTTFTLSDGHGYPIHCVVEPGLTLSSQWQRAVVVGVSSIFKINDITWWPRILVKEIQAY